jgi:hypothetical protein
MTRRKVGSGIRRTTRSPPTISAITPALLVWLRAGFGGLVGNQGRIRSAGICPRSALDYEQVDLETNAVHYKTWDAQKEEVDEDYPEDDGVDSAESDDPGSYSGRRDFSIRGNSEVPVPGIVGRRPVREDRYSGAFRCGPVCGCGRNRIRRLRDSRDSDTPFGYPIANRYLRGDCHHESSDALGQGLLGRCSRSPNRCRHAARACILTDCRSWAMVDRQVSFEITA